MYVHFLDSKNLMQQNTIPCAIGCQTRKSHIDAYKK